MAHDGKKVGGDRLGEEEDEELEKREDLTILSPAEVGILHPLSYVFIFLKCCIFIPQFYMFYLYIIPETYTYNA